jgi:hypothetical protein
VLKRIQTLDVLFNMTSPDFIDDDAMAYVLRSVTRYDVIPLPADLAPTEGWNLDHVSDDDIMAIPAHVLVHLMRTAAQNGTQVVSPRQIPTSAMLSKVSRDTTAPFVHVAGSDASRGYRWPVPPGCKPPDEDDLEGEPCMKLGDKLVSRTPAKAEAIVKFDDHVPNPIHKAWIKARAAVDFQNANTVDGDGDGLARAYEKLFGCEEGDLTRDPGLTVNTVQSLLHHAIVTDNSLARQLAPVQARRVISVAVGPSAAQAFGANRAFDWTAARVSAETKFRLTCAVEGHSLVDVSTAGHAPVGELLFRPGSRGGNVLVYHPQLATSWTYGPSTFAIAPRPPDKSSGTNGGTGPGDPPNPWVTEVLLEGRRFASPVAGKLANRAAVSWVTTNVLALKGAQTNRSADAFMPMATAVTRMVTGIRSVGKTPDRDVAREVYDALATCPAMTAVKMVAAIDTYIAVRHALGYSATAPPDDLDALAARLVSVDQHMHTHICSAAAMRNEDPDAWFTAMKRQAPRAWRDLKPGTRGWARLAVRLLVMPTNSRWSKLLSALRAKASENLRMTVSEATAVSAVLPELSTEMLTAKAKAVAEHLAAPFSARYDGRALGITLMARVLDKAGKKQAATMCRAAAAGWTLRQHFTRSIHASVGTEPLEHARGRMSRATTRCVPLGGKTLSVLASCNPARSYRAWYAKMCDLYGEGTVSCPDDVSGTAVSDCVALIRRASVSPMELDEAFEIMRNVPPALRYALLPTTLADDLDKTLKEVFEDVYAVVEAEIAVQNRFATADKTVVTKAPPPSRVAPVPAAARAAGSNAFFASAEAAVTVKTGWYWLGKAEAEDAAGILEAGPLLPDWEGLMAEAYSSADEFLDAYDAMESAVAADQAGSTDTFV